ncbi:PhzF family phenazine biosynthesis protein [uncultured Tateyamaria sp.]|uniref:PhzF family phenazine biosynthesis protein n=1 Tax=Tateyamaria sp. 1078 TaxID=3417464 RepID=UPI002613F0CA|nr:PhzF family phenazine biosynthesis protein [uncultured Tateyamaria sp.]
MTTMDLTHVHRIAAFSEGDTGGNPAGVWVADSLPGAAQMQSIADAVGYSETAFAAPEGDRWRVRYFAPECEVDFCGHATIALGAVLTERTGPGTHHLRSNAGEISVTGRLDDTGRVQIELSSPPTRSGPADAGLLEHALVLFGFGKSDLDPALPAAITHAGNDHLVLALRERARLSDMDYDLDAGRRLMERHGLTTINLIWAATAQRFHSRNAFAVGGVAEDPATGAAAAALGGYLRDTGWPHAGSIIISQGVDMGIPSKLNVVIPDQPGTPVRVSGSTRTIAQDE